ncbi:hypothetical protein ALICE_52 [Mycobacterium phage Alice]|uniref:Uncharacterized protein n=3 Tax=Bixzunavirus TaxID=680114 RepID=R4TA48_9CAUD|nr:hypothetical protein M182_gp060 [Mycobacterium phage Astraea]YP_009216317.1 hypothetical protein ALICE_52 [Mycobacterium phage Alice]AXN53889.1 hypothetical protein SEA_RABINOVISH_57 [Mycobacterium phage Rabinovish]QAX93363.1 hypothetical protein SEA_STUBBY_53 [Mycobacterium phage Stubby]AEJ94314.1 hypothetical protein ALICE_52 [Mycobacterium phage Alice]AGM13024.1 hypothetical protein PBI_ASTRAEA_59 [Mycobacterium phage Astraea]
MTIINPKHQFRLVFKVWLGNYKREQSFASAQQHGLDDVIDLLRQTRASALHPHIRSYVVQENLGTSHAPHWTSLDPSDWMDLL